MGRLLGMAKTTGTVPDGLPPPRSALLSSCMGLVQPNVGLTLMTLPIHLSILFLNLRELPPFETSLAPKTGTVLFNWR